MNLESNCVFCEILNNESDGNFVYKGEFVSVFLDINPMNKGHVLIVPNSTSQSKNNKNRPSSPNRPKKSK